MTIGTWLTEACRGCGHLVALVRDKAEVFLLLLILVLFAYLATQYQPLRSAQRALAQLHADIAALQSVQDSYAESLSLRLSTLEQVVYAEISPELRQRLTPTGIAQWQRNRDAEIRKRIEILERWRFRQDAATNQDR